MPISPDDLLARGFFCIAVIRCNSLIRHVPRNRETFGPIITWHSCSVAVMQINLHADSSVDEFASHSRSYDWGESASATVIRFCALG